VQRPGTVHAVLLDLDDTLFDHRHSARTALQAVHRGHDCFSGVPFDRFEQAHAGFLEELHAQVLAGRIPLDDARVERFRRLFTIAGMNAGDAPAQEAAAAYREHYQAARRAVAGALTLLPALRQRARVGIVSNNLLDEQQEKLRHCGLGAHVDALIVSEEAGVAKPDPAIFHLALRRLGATATQAVMIGDSWAADVLGARSAGMRAIWFNPLGLPTPEPNDDVIELRALEPVQAVLDAVFGTPVQADAHRR
jgi:HAD superfamily hydrolase (TIGR01549 family)